MPEPAVSPEPTTPPRTAAASPAWYVKPFVALASQPALASMVLPIGLSTLVGWLFYVQTVETIPGLQAAFQAEIKEQRHHDQAQVQRLVEQIQLLQRDLDDMRRGKLSAPNPEGP